MKNLNKATQVNGILLLDKPEGLSSAACLNKIKRELKQPKIGHAGTLDPMAKGLLVVLLGQATKLSDYLLQGGEKVYSGSLRLGLTTDTWDRTGRELTRASLDGITADQARAAVLAWVGEQAQEVPPYSAAKHQGQPLYKLARKGLETPVKTKTVKISRAEVESVDLPLVRFRVACSSGTYIRSLAHSLGVRLGCGATLAELTREYSHPFGLAGAFSLEALLAEPANLPTRTLGLEAALPDWPQIRLPLPEADLVKHGRTVRIEGLAQGVTPGQKALLLGEDGTPLALAEARDLPAGLCWHPLRGLWN